MQSIEHAQLHYNDQGTPVSDTFDDVYFSNESGLAETRYVFLQHNGLPERWSSHNRRFFHVIETGFGTGLNFLLCWQAFRKHRQQYPAAQCQQLYFSTFEKYPLTPADLQQALLAWPELSELATLLLTQYPSALPGCHRLQFDDASVTLDLWLGDVKDCLPQLPAENKADAWFLDGFAPSKNPQMWQDFLFEGMARLSQAGTSAATFTSAGLVRRGLQSAGFTVKKVKGFGRKREMAIAQMVAPIGPVVHANPPDVAQTEASIQALAAAQSPVSESVPATNVTLIGGGLASVLLALSLWQKGVSVRLLCADQQVAQGASHNRQGALYPQLQTHFSATTRFHLQAFGFASRRYQTLQQLFTFPASQCGVLTLACNDKLLARQQKIRQQLTLPNDVMHYVDAATASAIAGISLPFDGLFYPAGGWIAPQAFCQNALAFLSQQDNFALETNCQLLQADKSTSGWILTTNQGLRHADQLVLCTGYQLNQLPQSQHLPINQVRGQVSHVQATGLNPLKTVLCHQGYITPGSAEHQGESCVGATFDRSGAPAVVTDADNQANLDLVNQVFQQPDWFHGATVQSAKTGLRATVPDHLPIAGLLAQQLWVFGCLGARGLLFAPLLAEQLACQLSAQPSPLAADLAAITAATRFAPSS